LRPQPHPVLLPLSWIYRGLLALRELSPSVRKPERLPLPVVSVGNLVVGGAGKTPFVELVARTAMDMGIRPGILSRGYLRERGAPDPLLVTDGWHGRADWREVGDEPSLLARRLKDVPIAVGSVRARAGELLLGEEPAGLLILDDGFQHRRLHRDLNLVLVRADDPFGNGRLLPAGPLREPLRALRRADAVVLTSCPDTTDPHVAEVEARVRRRARPGVPLLHAFTEPEEPGLVAGRRVMAFCGLADPSPFQATLAALGARVLGLTAFPDHHPYTPDEIERLASAGRKAGAEILVTTEKDAVRLEGLELPDEPGVIPLSVRTRIHEEELLRGLLEGILRDGRS
jgi:tetraacyldisaccharide 4'-kinase